MKSSKLMISVIFLELIVSGRFYEWGVKGVQISPQGVGNIGWQFLYRFLVFFCRINSSRTSTAAFGLLSRNDEDVLYLFKGPETSRYIFSEWGQTRELSSAGYSYIGVPTVVPMHFHFFSLLEC